MEKSQEIKEPPFMLVKTWYDMLMQKESDEIRKIAKRNLLEAFGSQDAVMKGLVKHELVKKD